MRSSTLVTVMALSLVFVLALSLGPVRPARSDDFPKILAGLAVGYLVYSALDNDSSSCRDPYRNYDPPRDTWGYGGGQQRRAYNEGYSDGWTDGEQYGFHEGTEFGYQWGWRDGERYGYREGYKDGDDHSRWNVPRGGYRGPSYDPPDHRGRGGSWGEPGRGGGGGWNEPRGGYGW